MSDAFICDATRTAIGRFGGSLAHFRADDLAAAPIKALLARNPGLDPAQIDEVIYGCANQAGEDNRDVARMASLLAGLPVSVPGTTINGSAHRVWKPWARRPARCRRAKPNSPSPAGWKT